MKFTKDEILSSASFIHTSSIIVRVMPEYGEQVSPFAAIDGYCETYPKGISRNELISNFKEISHLKPADKVRWDVSLAVTTICALDKALRHKAYFGYNDSDRVVAIKCAIAIAKFIPDLYDVVINDIKSMSSLVESLQPLKAYIDKKGIDEKISKAAGKLIKDSEKHLNDILVNVQKRLKEIK